MTMPTLPDAYLTFDIEISFKPEAPNGLLLYSGQQPRTGDFMSLGLNEGYVEFRYELGSGVTLIKSEEPVALGKWSTVRIGRNRKDGRLQVNDLPTLLATATGRFQGLDLLEPFYIGAVPDFDQISTQAGFKTGKQAFSFSLV